MAQPMQTRRGRVLRAFYDHNRQPTKVGEIVILPRLLALEMAAAHKIELLEDEAPKAARSTTEPKSDPKPAAQK